MALIISPGRMSQNHLPHSLNLAYWMYKLLKKNWAQIWVRQRAPGPTLFGLGQQSAHVRQKRFFMKKLKS